MTVADAAIVLALLLWRQTAAICAAVAVVVHTVDVHDGKNKNKNINYIELA